MTCPGLGNDIRLSREAVDTTKCPALSGYPDILSKSALAQNDHTTIQSILRELQDGNPEPSSSAWVEAVNQLVCAAESSPALFGQPGIRAFWGNLIREVVLSTSILQANKVDMFRQVANLTKTFWKSTFATTIDGGAQDIPDDFVSSAMAEGRCIYFSNFMPFGREKFTRTIFVDIDMQDHQRARMLQRLCDILTYRSIPIRDLDRVRSAIEALNDLNLTLDKIQMEVVGAEGSPDKRMNDLHRELGNILDVSMKTGRLNTFFTYGIAGKWLSANAYFEQILERCEDVREQRIPGYPRLADFVQRRLRHSIRYIERMHGHHATVGQRSTELLDRVRTRLNSLQTEKMLEGISEQIALTRAAEIIVIFGTPYYLFSLIKPFVKSFPLFPEFLGREWFAASVAFLLLFSQRKYRDLVKRGVVAFRNRSKSN